MTDPPTGIPTEFDPKERAREALAHALGDDIYVCRRVWEAWSYGTMHDDDFGLASEDPDVLTNLVDALVAAGLLTPTEPNELDPAAWLCSCGKRESWKVKHLGDGHILEPHPRPQYIQDLSAYENGAKP